MAEKQIPASLRRNMTLLGDMLGICIAHAEGQECVDKIEKIRALAKSVRNEGQDLAELSNFLKQLDEDELLPVARAFRHFLNLSNLADQHHTISREMDEQRSATKTLESTFEEIESIGRNKSQIANALEKLKIDLVLTAHPTEITRRSLINKHAEIDEALSMLELDGTTEREQRALRVRLAELIAQIWHTEDFREHRPTPVDEAKWGFSVVENSLWEAVPNFIRRLAYTSAKVGLPEPALDYAPVCFSFWMGGDRDGNPNVTSEVTREVLLLSRWKAVDLYLDDIQMLIDELSMSACTPELAEMAEGKREPYRYLLREIRSVLKTTLEQLEDALESDESPDSFALAHKDQLWLPLKACYESLCECGMESIARGKLLDVIRRVHCFGVHLVRFDIRQESDRHTQALNEITEFLQLGSYSDWDESQRQSFLLSELQNPRPLIAPEWQPSEPVQEVLRTCAELARHPETAFGAYVISMAHSASDVLAVELLLKASGAAAKLPVSPLFETLDDLDHAADVIQGLIEIPWYKDRAGGQQMVMIGYSDSAKDAGVLAAGWAQYRAQESLLKVCDKAGVSLTLFHGRGGTIGRGGAPAKAALLSQPPGSLMQGLRVTEQGEMIRAKLGLSSIATKSLALYASAILVANMDKPPIPLAEWRELMDELSDTSCEAYRKVVRHDPQFVPYFREATPEVELAKLPLGSRPARRKTDGGIESLRAIPWIFAWSQNRLMLPAWLGAGQALQAVIDAGKQQQLEDMCESWPFFATRISMLEMVFAKTDASIAEYYDSVLVAPERREIGERLRQYLKQDIQTIVSIRNEESPMEDSPEIRASITFRSIYIDPLNILQAELLRRNREVPRESLDLAIMVCIAGISAGLRNTG